MTGDNKASRNMKIFVLRHGITGDSDSDESRQLTPRGVEEVESVVTRHKDDLPTVRHIICSPMPRVRHTVDLAAGIIDYQGDINESNDFTTGSRLKEIVRCMETVNPDEGDLLVSSHQSCTSILVLWLTGEDILIPNGSLLAIEADELAYGKGKILWQDSASSSEIRRVTNFVDQF